MGRSSLSACGAYFPFDVKFTSQEGAMPQKKYYNPQNDVVQIKDGRRLPVPAYDMYRAMHTGPSLSVLEKTENSRSAQGNVPEQEEDLFLRFDGRDLSLVRQDGDITTQYRFAAVSGRPVGEKQGRYLFSYDKERQNMENVGPIPEGNHTVKLGSARYWKDLGIYDKAKSVIPSLIGKKAGPMPGGPVAWGEGRVDVQLDPQVQEETGRSGITIHGGKYPGSAGCIDLVCNDKKFFDTLEKWKGGKTEIPLVVDYSQTPEEVWYPKEICQTNQK